MSRSLPPVVLYIKMYMMWGDLAFGDAKYQPVKENTSAEEA
jgi:hypothetical protein